jgi:hypothetical protein
MVKLYNWRSHDEQDHCATCESHGYHHRHVNSKKTQVVPSRQTTNIICDQWNLNSGCEKTLSTTPAGLHEKKSERRVQIVNRRLAAIKAALSYVLPNLLEVEAYINIIQLCNMLPTINMGTKTPHELFKRQKPSLPLYSFDNSDRISFKSRIKDH